MALKTGSHEFDLDNGWVKFRFDWSQDSQDALTNTSSVSWTVTIVTGNTTGTVVNQYLNTLKIWANGRAILDQTSTDTSMVPENSSYEVASGTASIVHRANGSGTVTWDISLTQKSNVSGPDSQMQSFTDTLEAIDRVAKITGITDYNDETSPSVLYNNPAGATLELNVIYWTQNPVSANIVATRTNVGKATSGAYVFAFTAAERNKIRQYAVNEKSLPLEFELRSSGTGWTATHSLETYCPIVNAEPTFTFSVVDTNSETINLTGDSNKIIKGYSKPKITVSASAKKYATIAGILVQSGYDSYQVTSSSFNHTFAPPTGDKLIIKVADSRGYINSLNTTFGDNFIDYTPISCLIETESIDFTDDSTVKTTFKISGQYFNQSFGRSPNQIRASYRYKIGYGEYGDWISFSPTKSTASYDATISIDSAYTDAITIEVNVSDALKSVIQTFTSKATPVFDWGESDFKFNVPVDIDGDLDVRGSINITKNDDYDSGNLTVAGDLEVANTATFKTFANFDGIVKIQDCYAVALVEYGSNNYWRWRKYSDGTAECWSRGLYWTTPVNTADGNVYLSGKCISPDFPFTFYEKPMVNITMNTGYAQGWIMGSGSGGTLTSTTNPGSFLIARPTAYTNGTYYVSIYAKGIWSTSPWDFE